MKKYILRAEIEDNLIMTQKRNEQVMICGACFIILGAILAGLFIVQLVEYLLS